jgi:hypothetical protein
MRIRCLLKLSSADRAKVPIIRCSPIFQSEAMSNNLGIAYKFAQCLGIWEQTASGYHGPALRQPCSMEVVDSQGEESQP